MLLAPLQKNGVAASNTTTNVAKQTNVASLPAVPIFQQKPIQKMEMEEEQPKQAKLTTQLKADTAVLPPSENNDNNNDGTLQLKELEEEMPLQGKFIIQKKEPEEQASIQAKFKTPYSVPTEPNTFQHFVLPKSNEPETVQTPIQRFVLPAQPIQKKSKQYRFTT